jgi:hypothetical protein
MCRSSAPATSRRYARANPRHPCQPHYAPNRGTRPTAVDTGLVLRPHSGYWLHLPDAAQMRHPVARSTFRGNLIGIGTPSSKVWLFRQHAVLCRSRLEPSV